MRSIRICRALLVCVGIVWSVSALAEFPERPIRLVVPYGPGGVADTMARIIQRPLHEILGQPVIVLNKPGALGALGAVDVARSQPDGYTILLGTNSLISALPLMKDNAGFMPNESFSPLGTIALSTMVMVAHPSLPAADMPSLLSYGKTLPGGLDCAVSGGLGSLSCEMLGLAGGFRVVRVPYKGVASAVNALLAGEVKFMINSTWPGLNEFLKQGRLTLIGVTGEETELVPNGVPASRTVRDLSVDIWYGLLAPAGTPPAVVSKLNDALAKALNDPDVREKFFSAGAVATHSTPQELTERIRSEVSTWKPVIQAAGLKLE